MGFFQTQTKLDTLLKSAGLPYNIAWEGVNFKPKHGEIYLRPTNLTATSSVLSLKNDVQANPGIYQIDVFYPKDGTGTGKLLRILGELKDYFKSNNNDDKDLLIREVSRTPIGETENSWLIGGIQIMYVSYF